MGTEWLSLNQSPDELRELYERDYYWYLRSPQFAEAFLRPLGHLIDSLGTSVLDMGCGEGQLSDYVKYPYYGIDGSARAVEQAQALGRNVHGGRIEDPCITLTFDVIVFGGILEVLIKPEGRVPLLEMYAGRFKARHLVVYDLERLDTSLIERHFGPPVFECHRVAEGIETEEVKRRRKILAWGVKR